MRHSFASFAIADGASLFMVGKVLGHKQARTTEIYAHLSDDPVKHVATRTAKPRAPRAIRERGRPAIVKLAFEEIPLPDTRPPPSLGTVEKSALGLVWVAHPIIARMQI